VLEVQLGVWAALTVSVYSLAWLPVATAAVGLCIVSLQRSRVPFGVALICIAFNVTYIVIAAKTTLSFVDLQVAQVPLFAATVLVCWAATTSGHRVAPRFTALAFLTCVFEIGLMGMASSAPLLLRAFFCIGMFVTLLAIVRIFQYSRGPGSRRTRSGPFARLN
jgi:hypothetical protein